MAQERIPDQATKSIVLSGGIQEDAPEFLQELPTLAYVENGRYRKANEVEKTLPWESLSFPGTNPRVIDSVGDTLMVIADEGLYEYTVDLGWKLREQKVSTATNDKLFSSAQAGGGVHYDWEESTKTGYEFFVVAYESRSTIGSTETEEPLQAGFQDVIVETFSTDYKPIKRYTLSGYDCPQVVRTSDGRVVVFCCGSTTGLLFSYDTSTGAVNSVSAGISGNIKVYGGSPNYDVMQGSLITETGYNAARAGFSRVGKNHWYKAATGPETAALVWMDSGDGDKIKLTLIDVDGSTFGNEVTVAADIFGFTKDYPLDCFVFGTGLLATVSVLWAQRISSPGNFSTIVNLAEYDIPLGSKIRDVEIDNGDFTVVNGSIGSRGPGDLVHYAYTKVGGNEYNRADTLIGRVELDYGVIFNTVVLPWGKLRHHRLTSNVSPTVDSMYFSCEQWGIQEPWSINQQNVQEISPPAVKPTTNIFVRATVAGVNVISCFDSNTSKHTNLFMSEQNPFLGRLRPSTNGFRYLNRQLLQGEDFSFTIRLPNSEDQDQKICFYVGDYRSNLYEVTIDSDKLVSSQFGNASIINTAIPQWYCGGKLSEVSILEQPEILYIDATSSGADDAEGQAYTGALWGDPKDWSLYQVVIGYTDALGYTHRSPPSFPVYKYALGKDNTTDQYRLLSFTLPITMLDKSDTFFVEIYSALSGEAPTLSFSTTFSPDHDKLEYIVEFRDLFTIFDTLFQIARTSEVVYTTGDVLPADNWPSFVQSVITSRRMFAITGNTVVYSKLFEENLSPEVHASFSIPIGVGRKLTGIGKIDDKVIVFEKDRIHALYGDGPDNTGQGAGFFVDPIQTTVGCEDPESIIEIPEGLLFYSSVDSSFHLLTNDLVVQDIGAPVSDLSQDIDITAAVILPSESEVRWWATGGYGEEYGPDPDTGAYIPARPPRPRYQNVLPENPVFCFNYGYNKWTILSGDVAKDAVRYNDTLAKITTDDVQVVGEQWSNSGLLEYRTPWVRVQDLQSFGRIREVNLLGKYLSDWKDNGNGFEAGDIEIEMRYDYEAQGQVTTYRWKANKDLSPLYGDRLQISMKPGRPKCQAIQITVREVPTEKIDEREPDYTNGRGFVLSGLDLVYSLKRGLGRQSVGQPRSK